MIFRGSKSIPPESVVGHSATGSIPARLETWDHRVSLEVEVMCHPSCRLAWIEKILGK